MGDVIYSASPFQTFLTSFGTILFFFVLGGVGVGSAFLRSGQTRGARVGLGLAGGVLLIAGCAMSVVTFQSLTTGSKNVAARLNDKTKATDNCGDGDTCSRFVLEMQAGQKFYDVTVPEGAFDRTEIGRCYQVTYYPNTGLFSPSANSDSYQAISNVSRIEQLDTAACQ
jgi:hypothetical protein